MRETKTYLTYQFYNIVNISLYLFLLYTMNRILNNTISKRYTPEENIIMDNEIFSDCAEHIKDKKCSLCEIQTTEK